METGIAENTAPVETTEADAEVVETKGEDSAPSGTETAASGDDTSSWTEKAQQRFDKLTREKYEGLSRAERAEYRAQELERRLAEIEARQTAQPEQIATADEFPTLESVGYDEDKLRAEIARYYARQTDQSVQAVLQREREAAQREQLETAWQRKQQDFIKSKPDYAEKVGSLPRSLMTDALAAEIKETGNPEIAYYLSENLEKLAEIARLPPTAQAREIGRIEARLEAAKTAPPPVSKAPPPPAKIEASEASGLFDPTDPSSDRLSPEEWLKRRNKQVKKLNQR